MTLEDGQMASNMQAFRILVVDGAPPQVAQLQELTSHIPGFHCQVLAVEGLAALEKSVLGQAREVVVLWLSDGSGALLHERVSELRRLLSHQALVVIAPRLEPTLLDVARQVGCHHLLQAEDLSPWVLVGALESACRLAYEETRSRGALAAGRESERGERGFPNEVFDALRQGRVLEIVVDGRLHKDESPASTANQLTRALSLGLQNLVAREKTVGTPEAVTSLHTLVEHHLHDLQTNLGVEPRITLGAITPVLAHLDPHLAGCLIVELLLVALRHPALRDGFTVNLGRHQLTIPATPGGPASGPRHYAVLHVCSQVMGDASRGEAVPQEVDAEVLLQRLVRLAGGYVRREETSGWISSLRIFLPCLPELADSRPGLPESTTPTSPEGTPSPKTSPTVLVAEDQKEIRKLVRMVLEAQGYSVIEAADGARALQVIESTENTLDLVISDLVMPHLGGLEIAEKLATARPGTPFVLMSGYNSSTHSSLEGMAVLNKPFRPDELTRLVKQALKR